MATWLVFVLFSCKDTTNSGTTSIPTPTTDTAGVVEFGVLACADPATALPYTRNETRVPQPSEPWIWHGGISAGDLDGDGWLDVLVATELGLELYHNEGDGSFATMGQNVFPYDLTYAAGTSLADYDGDGDLDVYVMRIAGDPAPEWTADDPYGMNHLLRNDGNLTFTDVTEAAGVDACGPHHRTGVVGCWKSMASSWGDIDGDGDLDLYVGNYGFVDETPGTQQADMGPAEPDYLYLNDGDGTFSDVSERLPTPFHDGYTYAGGFFDMDDDGDLDLYNINDFGTLYPNRPLWNDGTGLFESKDQAQDLSGLGKSMTGMGLGIGDLNGDELMDMIFPVWQHHQLLESRTGATTYWVDASDLRGVFEPLYSNQEVPWGTEMGDVDNDGDLDAVTQYGFVLNENPVWVNARQQPDALYINEETAPGEYVFTDQAEAWGLADPGMSRGVVLADVDRDGWLDIGKRVLDDNGALSGSSVNVLYQSTCGTAGWLLVHLRQPDVPMNQYAIGAKVLVKAGGRTFTRWLHAGGTGYASAPPPELHFGLGDVDVVDEIIVRWPDGTVTTAGPVDARQQVTLTR